MFANKRQVQIIHVLKSLLKLDDETYRDMLRSYGVSTSTRLLFADAADLVSKMQSSAVAAGVSSHKSGSSKPYENLGVRPGMANPAQLRKIGAIWAEVSRATNASDRAKALNHFLERFGVQRIEWLPHEAVSKVLRALHTMKASANRKVAECQLQ